jgi:hypothetical protein
VETTVVIDVSVEVLEAVDCSVIVELVVVWTVNVGTLSKLVEVLVKTFVS